jgi:YVTN family beta-propeller protein
VAVSPDGSRVYVTNFATDNLSVFDAATNAPVVGSPFATGGTFPFGVAVSPDGSRVYVTNQNSSNLSVFDAATNAPMVGSPFATGGTSPEGVATCPPAQVVPSLAPDLVVRFTG